MLIDLAELIVALDDDAVVPCYQPIVNLRSGVRVGFEVLARCQHPVHGPILPANFISLAEENGLIGRVSEQVFRKAFVAAKQFEDSCFLSVNLSPTQLHDIHLSNQLTSWAEESGFPLQRLTIEVTETALLDNLDIARKITDALRSRGCKLALDDFGTGYSSLLHLQSLPFDKLKVDRSFVRDMVTARQSRKIVAAVLGLGDSLGLITVAEGIETPEQAEMLLSLGCKLGQGWLYGRPMSADAIAASAATAAYAGAIPSATPDTVLTARSLEAHPSEQLAQLQAIYHGAPVGLCYLDRNLRYVNINRQLAEMNNTPLADHIGRTVREIHPQLYPRFEPYLLRALRGEAIHGVEIARPPRTPGAAQEYSLASYQPVWDEAGEVIALSISVIDVTQLKRAQEELRESDDLYRHIFEMNPQIPWIMDSQGNSLQVNHRWTSSNGWSDLFVRGQDWLVLVHPEDAFRVRTSIRKALQAGTPIDVQYRAGSEKAGWRWMRSRASPHLDANGVVTRWYGLVEDIDQRKLMEDRLQVV